MALQMTNFKQTWELSKLSVSVAIYKDHWGVNASQSQQFRCSSDQNEKSLYEWVISPASLMTTPLIVSRPDSRQVSCKGSMHAAQFTLPSNLILQALATSSEWLVTYVDWLPLLSLVWGVHGPNCDQAKKAEFVLLDQIGLWDSRHLMLIWSGLKTIQPSWKVGCVPITM